MFGSRKGIGQAEVLNLVAAQQRDVLPVPFAIGGVLQHPLEFRIEDVFADQPAAVIGESGQILVFAGEQLLMIHVIAELGLLQFVLQGRGMVQRQFLRDEREDRLSSPSSRAAVCSSAACAGSRVAPASGSKDPAALGYPARPGYPGGCRLSAYPRRGSCSSSGPESLRFPS